MKRKRRLNKKIFTVVGIILFVAFFVIFAIVRTSNARYASTATSATKLDVALYALREDNDLNILLDTLVPRDEPYVYTFSVINSDGTNITDAALVYDLKIIATTNIPLEYKLCMNVASEAICKNSSTPNAINVNMVTRDDDGTFFRTMTTTRQEFGFEQEEHNDYILLVYFPSRYNSSQYQDLVESIQINVDSKQKLESDG